MTAESNVGVTLESICVPSDDIVAREIEGDIVIVPLVAGIGDMDDELFTLNETATAIWNAADGVTPLREIVEQQVCREFETSPEAAYQDALSLVEELAKHGILLISGQPTTLQEPTR